MAANNDVDNAQRFRNGLPAEATLDDKLAFATHCLQNYRVQQWSSDSLSEYFAEDFRGFTADDFKSIDSDTRRNLRDLLRSRGVFVPKGRNVLIADALYRVAKEDLPWPEDDSEKPIKESTQLSLPPTQKPNGGSAAKEQVDLDNSAIKNEFVDVSIDQRPIDTCTESSRPWKRNNMANLFKAYTGDDDKYSGATTDNFERKFMLFLERCEQADIPEEDRNRAFSIMLTGHARQFYFDFLKMKNLSLADLESAVKSRFLTPERTRALLREWDNLSLSMIISTNASKSPSACLELLIEKLSDIQTSLPWEYRNETILKNKLLNAVKDVKACQLAYHKPSETVQGVISDLHASIATLKFENSTDTCVEPSANFVDRRLVKRSFSKTPHTNRDKKCFVCGKHGCWSSNHPAKERLQSYRKNKSIRQFIASFQSTPESDEEDELTADAIEDIVTHMIHIQSDDDHGNNQNNEDDEDAHDTFSHMARLDDDDTQSSFIAQLQNTAFSYAATATVPKARFGTCFHGILIDTGAAKGSSAGVSQYKAYCNYVGKNPDVDNSKAAVCHFGIGSAKSQGMGQIIFPVGTLWLKFYVHIVDADTPILLSIDDMDRLGIYLNNLEDRIVHPSSGMSSSIVRKRGHPFLLWNPYTSCMLTSVDLQRLHRRFGHPSTDKLMKLLKRSELQEIGPETRHTLEKIERSCDSCQTYAQKPRRFKFTLRDDKDFNHTIYADIFYIDGKPILHIVDEATNFQSAKWLKDMTAETLWKTLRMCWIDVYLGPPDVIAHDAGKNFMAAAFQANADMLHINTKSIPVESANSMTIVERYHAPIRRAFNIIKKECPECENEEALQMAVKSINDSVGPDGLTPTLLVFGALPRLGLPSDKPTKSTFQRAIALRNATALMSKHFAKRQVRDALRARNGPDVTDVHKTPIGAPVLVYRPEKDRWEGPYSLLDLNGEDVMVLTSKGAQKFRSTVVKPYLTPESENNESVAPPAPQLPAISALTTNLAAPLAGRFDRSRVLEFNGLMDRGVFTVVPASEAKNNRVFGARFVDSVKYEGKPHAFEKSRLVVQAYNDKDHGYLTYAPTVQRVSQRLMLAICAMDAGLQFFTRDVSQAYVQSDTSTKRPIFVRPPEALNLPPHVLLRVDKPLYGIPEAGLHWYKTYHSHHMEKLSLIPTVHDPCFLFTKAIMSSDAPDSPMPRGLTCLQTDDTASCGNDAFLQKESKMASRFDCKPIKILSNGNQILFNGASISLDNGTYAIEVNDHIDRLQIIDLSRIDKPAFVTQRARGAYIAAVGRPDLTFGFAVASQVLEPDENCAKELNKVITLAKASIGVCLKFVPVDRRTLRLAAFCDASFASNKDLTSQLGYVVALADANGNANIIHYSSVKSKRVTRSVLAAELFAAIHAFDFSSTLRLSLNEMFGYTIPLILYTDSKSLFDSVTNLNSTTEKRLLIDLCVLRRGYELRELTEIVWIPSHQNPADAMTKAKPTKALDLLVKTNKVSIDPKTWIERPISVEKKSTEEEKRKTREDPRSHRSAAAITIATS